MSLIELVKANTNLDKIAKLIPQECCKIDSENLTALNYAIMQNNIELCKILAPYEFFCKQCDPIIQNKIFDRRPSDNPIKDLLIETSVKMAGLKDWFSSCRCVTESGLIYIKNNLEVYAGTQDFTTVYDKENKYGNVGLMYALSNGNYEVTKILKNYESEAKDKEGRNAVEVAKDVLTFLIVGRAFFLTDNEAGNNSKSIVLDNLAQIDCDNEVNIDKQTEETINEILRCVELIDPMFKCSINTKEITAEKFSEISKRVSVLIKCRGNVSHIHDIIQDLSEKNEKLFEMHEELSKRVSTMYETAQEHAKIILTYNQKIEDYESRLRYLEEKIKEKEQKQNESNNICPVNFIYEIQEYSESPNNKILKSLIEEKLDETITQLKKEFFESKADNKIINAVYKKDIPFLLKYITETTEVARDHYGRTPLMHAVFIQNNQIISLLKDKEGKLRDKNDISALGYAIILFSSKTILNLLKQPEEYCLQFKNGINILSLAILSGNHEAFECFKTNIIMLNDKNKDGLGKSSFDYAIAKDGFEDTLDYFTKTI